MPCVWLPIIDIRSKKSKRRKIIVILVIAFVLLIACVLGINFVKQVTLAKYSVNMIEAAQTMANGSAKAEKVGNLVISVWNNALYEKRDLT